MSWQTWDGPLHSHVSEESAKGAPARSVQTRARGHYRREIRTMLLRIFHRAFYYVKSVFLLLGRVHEPILVLRLLLGERSSCRILRLKRDQLAFSVRDRMDLWMVKETLLDRAYEQSGFAIQNGWNVLDIGAGIGDFAILAAQQTPQGIVHAYEPFPESFRHLTLNLSLNRIRNVTAFKEAINGAAGSAYLDLSWPSSVFYRCVQRPIHGKSTQVLEVPAVTLEQALSRLNGAGCDLLKLDCEGAEYEIVIKAGINCWKRVRRIVLEYHDFEGTGRHWILFEHLRRVGFNGEAIPSRIRTDIGLFFLQH